MGNIDIVFGNCRSDYLSKQGMNAGFEGPEPFIPIPKSYITSTINLWVSEQIKEEWRFSTTGETTKLILAQPNSKLATNLLKLNKAEIRTITGLLTGHCKVNSYLRRIGLRDDTDCDFCGRAEDTSMHFLCECTGFTNLRRQIFSIDPIPLRDVINLDLPKVLDFVHRSKRQLM